MISILPEELSAFGSTSSRGSTISGQTGDVERDLGAVHQHVEPDYNHQSLLEMSTIVFYRVSWDEMV